MPVSFHSFLLRLLPRRSEHKDGPQTADEELPCSRARRPIIQETASPLSTAGPEAQDGRPRWFSSFSARFSHPHSREGSHADEYSPSLEGKLRQKSGGRVFVPNSECRSHPVITLVKMLQLRGRMDGKEMAQAPPM